MGRLKDDKTVIDGKTYEMARHGFARKTNFKKLGENSYVLVSNEETKKVYPYDFELYLSYESEGNTFINHCRVVNKGKDKMYFGLGFHPAFKCDYSNGKYYVEFEEQEDRIEIKEVRKEDGYIARDNVELSKHFKDNILYLNENSFIDDAIVLTSMKSNRITLRQEDKPILTFDFTDFPYLGVWSKIGAPYVCFEPWFNTADKARVRWSF